jgi:hypothetical protein
MQQLALVLLFVRVGAAGGCSSRYTAIHHWNPNRPVIVPRSLEVFTVVLLSVSAPNFFVRSPFEARKSGLIHSRLICILRLLCKLLRLLCVCFDCYRNPGHRNVCPLPLLSPPAYSYSLSTLLTSMLT